jgi:hypothetical protein
MDENGYEMDESYMVISVCHKLCSGDPCNLALNVLICDLRMAMVDE